MKKNNTTNRFVKSIEKISFYESKILNEIKKIESLFVFNGFQEVGLKPMVNLCSGFEVAIVCDGYELDIVSAINIQMSKGLIQPHDIPGLII